MAYLQEHSLIDGYKPGKENENENVKALAVFLRSNGRLDKKLLGEYISNPDNLDLLKAYIGLFDFKGVSVDLLNVADQEECFDPILPFRNPSQKPCESCWKLSVCQVKPSRLLGLRKCSRSITSPSSQVSLPPAPEN